MEVNNKMELASENIQIVTNRCQNLKVMTPVWFLCKINPYTGVITYSQKCRGIFVKYGYARVSTIAQASSGNSLEAQQRELKKAGAEKIYVDHFTGKSMNRPEFDKLRKELSHGDMLIVTKMDRFARSVSQASDLISDLIDAGVQINVLNLGVLSNDSVSTLMRNIMLCFAQFERDMIVERTQEGKAMARMHDNYHEGRPRKFTKVQMDHAMKLLEAHSYRQVAEMTGISKSSLVRERRRRFMNN